LHRLTLKDGKLGKIIILSSIWRNRL